MRKSGNNLLEKNNSYPISFRPSAVDLSVFVPSRLFRISLQNVFRLLLVVLPSIHIYQYISVYIVNGDVIVIKSNDAFISLSLSFSTLCSKILFKKSLDILPCRYPDRNQGRRHSHRQTHSEGAIHNDET